MKNKGDFIDSSGRFMSIRKFIRAFLILSVIIIPFFSVAQEESVPTGKSVPEWQVPDALRGGQVSPHFPVIPFRNDAESMERSVKSSPYFLSLNGTWSFSWMENSDYRPMEFFSPEVDLLGWDTIQVPGNWERQGFGIAFYAGEKTERTEGKKFPVTAEMNEVGSYRRNFALSSSWNGRRVVLRFEGVSSFFYVWLNGELLGYNQGTGMPAEWDITDKVLYNGENNVLAVEVYRWSSSSALENAGTWQMSGIERDVYLYSTPLQYIADYEVTADLDEEYKNGEFALRTQIRGVPGKSAFIRYILKDSFNNEVLSEIRPVAEGKENQWIDFPMRKITDVLPWSSEKPYLYTLDLELLDSDRYIMEYTGCKVGFRNVRLKEGVLLVNGVHVRIKGVARREHSWEGRVLSEEVMLEDIRLMKRNNINAVLNSYCPASPVWYELCDRYGIYIVDRAYIAGKDDIVSDTAWRPAYLDRVQRMYQRSKNYPSVVGWSLGSGAGNGINAEKSYDWLKAKDTTRFIMSPFANEEHADILGLENMTADSVKACSEGVFSRPFIVEGYMKASGNNLGGLSDYWKVLEDYPQVQGGFITEWADCNFREKGRNGKDYWEYRENEKGTSADGLVASDRIPYPHLEEVKAVYQDIRTEILDRNPASLRFKVINRNAFTNLNEFSLYWSYMNDLGQTVRQGIFNIDVNPGDSSEFTLPEIPERRLQREIFVNLSWRPVYEMPFLGRTDDIAFEQYVIKVPEQETIESSEEQKDGTRLRRDKATGIIRNNLASFRFSKETGALVSYRFEGNEYLKEPMELCFYRPATDNDRMDKNGWAGWKAMGLDSTYQRLTGYKVSFDKKDAIVRTEVDIFGKEGNRLFEAEITYRLFFYGKMEVICRLKPADKKGTLARIGWRLVMGTAYDNIRYFGKGTETYPDRNEGGRVGLHNLSSSEMFYPYARPQETGTRMEVRWAIVYDKYLNSLMIHSERPFMVSLSPYEDSVVERASRLDELTDTGANTLHIDYRHAGIGGAASGVGTDERFLIRPEEEYFKFIFIPFTGSDNVEISALL